MKININKLLVQEMLWQVFLIFLLLQHCQTVRDFDIRFIKANCCIWNKDYVADYSCPIQELPRNRGNYLSTNIWFKRNITQMIVDIRIHIPGNAQLELVTFRTDGCQLERYKASNPFVAAILKKLLSGGNFPGGCPLKANVNYSIKHFALNPDYLPPYTPEMAFAATFKMAVNRMYLLSSVVEAKIVKKKS